MKWTIYLLLLVNLGVFVWHYQPGGDTRQQSSMDFSNRLVLAKEYDRQSRGIKRESGPAICFSLGPFTRREAFTAAKTRMEKAGIEIFSRVSSEAVLDGYWVLLPVAESGNQARVQVQKLKENGVNDYFLVATGEMKNAVSLGVFSKPKLAKSRRDEVAKLGFDVKIRKIALPKRVYWLEWPRQSGTQPDNRLLGELLSRFEGIGQTERPCPSAQDR